MPYGSQCLAAAAVACGLLLAGCSGDSPPAAQGKALSWLAPYLTDDFPAVVLVDTEKLGPLWSMSQGLLKMAAGDKLPDLSDVELAAVVSGYATNPDMPPNGAILFRTKAPLSAEDQQKLLGMARGMLNLPTDDKEYAEELAWLDPAMAKQIAPKLVMDGNTTILGFAAAVDSLQAKTGAGANLVKALNALGEHAVNVHMEIGEPQRAHLTAMAETQQQRGDEPSPSEASIQTYYAMMAQSRSFAFAVDMSPSLGWKFRFAPALPKDLATIRDEGKSLLDLFQGMAPEMKAAAQKKGGSDLVFAKVMEDMASKGQLTDGDGVVQLEWKSSPELATEFQAALPAAIAEAAAASRRAAQTAMQASKLKQVGNGLLLFADRYHEHLPCNIMSADGKPLMSWRVALLPVMEHRAIFDQLRMDEPWDSAHNAALLKQVDPRLFAANSKTPDGHADLLAVIGKDFGFSPQDSPKQSNTDDPYRAKEAPDFAGVARLGNVIDGMAYTAFVVAVDPANSVPWAKPEDHVFNPDQPTAGLGSPEDNFFQVVFGDTRVNRISKDESAETLRRMFGRNDGEPYDLIDTHKHLRD